MLSHGHTASKQRSQVGAPIYTAPKGWWTVWDSGNDMDHFAKSFVIQRQLWDPHPPIGQ